MNPETEKKDAYSPEELAILSDQEVTPTEPAPEAEPEPQREPEPEPLPAAEQPRQADGTFAPKGASEAEAPNKGEQSKSRLLSDLKEQRAARQQIEKDLQAAREEKAKLEGAFQALSQRFAQPQEPAKQPTLEEDPVAVLRQTQQQLNEMQRQQQEQQITAQFSNHVRSLAEQFRSTVPDYADALKFAGEARRKQLAYFGMGAQQIEQQLQRDEFELSAAALQNGRNPAQVIYETAQLWGYRAGAQANGQAQPIQNQQSGGGPNLETIAKGQTASRSLGNVGGSAPNTLTGIDRLANMTEKELDKLSPEDFRKIMEG